METRVEHDDSKGENITRIWEREREGGGEEEREERIERERGGEKAKKI